MSATGGVLIMGGEIVWVLTCHYDDWSGYAVVRVYTNEVTAKEDLEMLRHYTSDRVWTLHPTPVKQ